MIVSLNWLKKYVDINLPIDELSRLIGARLVEIEEIVSLKDKYKDAVIVRVVNAEKLADSDHLSLTKVDDDGAVETVERDNDGHIQVVCGAPNIKTGQTVVWLPPNSVVPETFGKSEQFRLEARKIRGFVSNGMIASSRELDLSDEHEGILTLQDDIKPGTSLVDYLNYDDYLIDIENKSLTHRPDCFGVIGIARELAGIECKRFENPEWMNKSADNDACFNENKVDLKVSIDDGELSARYTAVVMSNIDNSRQTPLEIQSYLSRIGIRPISAVVDVTNYLMILTGQPLHAFDYDKVVNVSLGNPEIKVRAGRQGEKLELLDGKVIELSIDDIVIAAGETAIGLAGAMGGANTAIDANTKNIIIESATFNLYNLRSTQMRHGIFSEAITRFTKGQPAELSIRVLNEAIKLMNEWTGAVCVSKIRESYPVKQQNVELLISVKKINDILGTSYSANDITSCLSNVGFVIQQSDVDELKIGVPFWRADIHIVEDVAEEIGRLNGFDDIIPTLPNRDFTASMVSEFDTFRAQVRNVLSRAGANEVLTYNFVHGNILNKVGLDPVDSYRIINSISPELQYYRQSLVPSLLGLVHPNIKQGYEEFAIFELNKVHQKSFGLTTENVPIEKNRLSLVTASKMHQSGAPYYQAKAFLNYLSNKLGLELVYKRLEKDETEAMFRPFEYRRSAKVLTKDNAVLGVIGDLKRQVIQEFKLPDYTAGFEMDIDGLFNYFKAADKNHYKPISRYPSVERDICFQVASDVEYSQLHEAVRTVLSALPLETTLSTVDIYQANDSQLKNITMRIVMTSYDHTLTSDEASGVIGSVVDGVAKELEIKVI